MGGADDAVHVLCSENRSPDDIEDLENMLEWHSIDVCTVSVCTCVCSLHV